jgi:hypothetical protein
LDPSTREAQDEVEGIKPANVAETPRVGAWIMWGCKKKKLKQRGGIEKKGTCSFFVLFCEALLQVEGHAPDSRPFSAVNAGNAH